jgi:ribosomal protein S18 acetylase RimI-like enzyme
MDELLARAYDATSLRIGDLAWLSRETSHRALSLDIRLWEFAAGELGAWAYVRDGGGFNLFLAPGTASDALVDDLVAFVEDVHRAGDVAGDPRPPLDTYGIDPERSAEDAAIAAGLERAGFRVEEFDVGVTRRSLDDLPAPALPAGYHLDWVRSRELLLGHVEAHRLAFAPSELTAKRYERLQRAWCYRAELDRVVVTDSGEVVSYATAWFDESNAAGHLEPVGTVPAHQRRGLASAVCLDALHALRAAGARVAQVAYGSGEGLALYRSIGFEPFGNELVFMRS